MTQLSTIQRATLARPCPLDGAPLRVVGDLSDFAHDIVLCANEESEAFYCDFAMFYDGSTMDTPAPAELTNTRASERFNALGQPRG